MASFFLFCFGFGVLFSLASTLLGLLGAGLHGLGIDAGHHGHHEIHGPWGMLLNPSAFLVGLTVFGALGYMAVQVWLLPLVLVFAVAAGGGLAGHVALAAVSAKLRQDTGVMQDADYQLAGTLAGVSVSIAAGAVGEVVFDLGGVRRSEAARALDGGAIAKGQQVVIVGYERGVALVQPARELENLLETPPRLPERSPEELG